jgi:hypothetical protein
MKSLIKNYRVVLPAIVMVMFSIVFFIIRRPIEGASCFTIACGLFGAKANNVTGVGDNARNIKN